MSYRRAWLLIDELNHIFEEPVIDAKHGGSGGGGAELTRFGHRVVERARGDQRGHAQGDAGDDEQRPKPAAADVTDTQGAVEGVH